MDKKLKTFSQVANEYGIHTKTLRARIKPIKEDLHINNKKLLLPWQTQMIYDFLDKKN